MISQKMSLQINQIKPSIDNYQLICDEFAKKKKNHFSVIVNFYELNRVKALHCKFMTTCLTVHFVKSGIVHDILEMHMRQKVFQQNIDTWHVVIWPRIHCQSLEIPCSATKSNLFGFLRSNGHLDPVRQKGTKSQDRPRNYQRVREKFEFFDIFAENHFCLSWAKWVSNGL